MSMARRRIVCLLALVVIVAGLVWWLSTPRPPDPILPHSIKSLPAPESPFFNIAARATYVGTETCIECHANEHKSYLNTAHSQALSLLDPKREPNSASFYHELSRRRYEIYRKDGVMHHRESVHKNGQEIVALDYPVQYLIGSGRHTRSYLIKADGFLVESPITWYALRKQWDMSPGYDRKVHASFERTVGTRCLYCHAGAVKHKPDSRFHVRIRERAISCERCHGPGSLHAARHRSKKPFDDLADLTIVKPSRLSRSRLESVCGQCHLQADAAVPVRGRSEGEFRPGLLLSDFRVDYSLERPESQMTVVGHIEQLRLSKCYQQDQKLTCLTCHDLHAREPISDKIAYFRAKCISCHAPSKCREPLDKRIQTTKRDNCVTCHMPKGGTDIPHIAFTHHRIGIHRKKKEAAQEAAPLFLTALEDVSRFPTPDQDRCLGLGYLSIAGKADKPHIHRAYLQRARQLLDRAYQKGLRDRETLAGLAVVYHATDPRRALELAKRALQAKAGSPDARTDAMFLLALGSVTPSESLIYLRDLTKLRRSHEDWYFLGLCYEKLGNPQEALKALKQAEAINPFRPDVYLIQAKIHDRLGEKVDAMNKRKIAKRLAELK